MKKSTKKLISIVVCIGIIITTLTSCSSLSDISSTKSGEKVAEEIIYDATTTDMSQIEILNSEPQNPQDFDFGVISFNSRE